VSEMQAPDLTVVEKRRNRKSSLIRIDIKNKEGKKVGEKDFLPAHEAMQWFHEDYPLPVGRILTFPDFEHNAVRAEIWIDDALVATGHSAGKSGADAIAKMETVATRRALAQAGYGTVGALAEGDDDDIKTQARAAKAVHESRKVDADPAEMLGAGTDRRIDPDGRKQTLRQQIVQAVDHPYYKNAQHVNNAVSRLFKADLLHEGMVLAQAVKIVENLGTYRENGMESDAAIEAVRKDAAKANTPDGEKG
jgi:hypothetical protein